MSKKKQSTTEHISPEVIKLKPLIAGMRWVIAGGLFAGLPGQVNADSSHALPIPIGAAQILPNTLPVESTNANLPWLAAGTATEQTDNTAHTKTIKQTSDKIILNWDQFSIGQNASVQFAQPGASSVALNRINNETNGTTILGHLTANGEVYLVNNNGFVFGNNAVVDTNSLVVSTLGISDAVINKTANIVNNNTAGSGSDATTAGLDGSSSSNPNASIQINAGANIHAGAGGRIIMAAPTVENDGALSADKGGQILLVASQDKVYLQQHSSDKNNPWNGLLVEVGSGGKVTNKGNMNVRQGNVTMAGFVVNQDGRINVTTSVNVNGSVKLQAAEGLNVDSTNVIGAASTQRSDGTQATLTFGAGSVTQASADNDGSQLTYGTIGNAPASSIQASAYTVDVKGATLDAHGNVLQQGAQIIAHGGNVNLTATDNPADTSRGLGRNGHVIVESQANIDVSGLQNVAVAADKYVVDISVQSYELRNSPLQLAGVLKGQTVSVDTSQNTSIIDTSAAAKNIPVGINEIMTNAGQINLTSTGDVQVNAHANLDIAGGSIYHQEGYFNTTKLVDDNGRIIDISAADPNMHFAAIFGLVTEDHAKWGVSDTWNVLSTIQGQGQYHAAYTQGMAAGSLNIQAPLLSWHGDLQAGTITGINQRNLANAPVGGVFNIDNQLDNNGNLTGYILQQNVLVQNGNNQADAAATNSSNLVLDATQLSSSGLSSLSVYSQQNITVAKGTNYALTDGSSLTLRAAADLALNGNIHGYGAVVNLKTDNGNINLATDSSINVSGRWLNDQASWLQTNQLNTAPLYINGGSVSVKSGNNLTVDPTAAIKANAGGLIATAGAFTAGRGGKIDLESKNNFIMAFTDQTLSAYGIAPAGNGIAQGGTLTLSAGNVVVGNADNTDPTNALVLGVHNGKFDFAQNLSFNNINLTSLGNLTVKSGVDLNLVTADWQVANNQNLHSLPTDTAISSYMKPTLLADNQRQAVQLSLAVANDALMNVEQGSSITVDKSTPNMASAINLSSAGSIYVDGTLSAPAGNINLTINPTADVAYDPTQAIWVGSDAHLLALGTTRLNPLNNLGKQTGTVLDGGDISFNANRGYVILQQNAVVDVSGTRHVLDIAQQTSNGLGNGFVSKAIGSNAGSINITAAEGAVVAASLQGKAGLYGADGKPLNLGGSLSLTLDNSHRAVNDPTVENTYTNNPQTIFVTQTAATLNASIGANLDNLNLHNQARIAFDQVYAGGFSNLSLNVPSDNSGLHDGNVSFVGDINQAPNLPSLAHLAIDSPIIDWVAAAGGSSTGNVTLNATYITLGSSSSNTIGSTPVTGGGLFDAEAQWMQLQGGSVWNGFNTINLHSQHDLRLQGDQLGQNSAVGEMSTIATLNLAASQIYPTTLTSFTLNDTGQSIAIKAAGVDALPLSAAGSLTFNAANIDQGGVVAAPLGSITYNASNSLTLEAGSVTTVSAAGLLIPFGNVQGGKNWLYPFGANASLLLNTPPTKSVVMNAPSINLKNGSKVDLAGGGDLLASEFKPIASGFPDFLLPGSASYNGSFAILPTLGSSIAPFDPNIMSSWGSAGNIAHYGMGSRVELAASAGLPAGSYTILPAYYALLPGAYLVTPVSNSQDATTVTASTSGLAIVPGQQVLAGTSIQDSRTTAYQIETSVEFLQNHPEYLLYCASNCSATITEQAANLTGQLAANLQGDLSYLLGQNLLTQNFYYQTAQGNTAATPILPTDSGQITLNAQTNLVLQGDIVTSTPKSDEFTTATPAHKGDTSLILTNGFGLAAGWAVGDFISGTGIAANTYIKSISDHTITLSNALTGNMLAGSIVTNTDPSVNGRGAQMDIAATNIEVVHAGNTGLQQNALQISDADLSKLNVDSLLLGGNRTKNEDIYALANPASQGGNQMTFTSTVGWQVGDQLSGLGINNSTTTTTITAISGNTVTLSAALTANVAAGSLITDNNSALVNGATNVFVTANNVTFDSGVNLAVKDLLATATEQVLVTGSHNGLAGASLSAAGSVNTGESKLNLIGDSAILRVSADQQVSTNRYYYSGTPGTTGQLTVETGANLTAAKSMLLDATQATQMDGNIIMHGGSLSLGASNINIGAARAVTGIANALNLTNQQLANLTVDQLILNSKEGISFYGAVGQVDSNGNPIPDSQTQNPLIFKDLVLNAAAIAGYGNKSDHVRLKADSLELGSTATGSPSTVSGSGQGELDINATNFTATGGNVAVTGFNKLALTVNNEYNVAANSGLQVAADTTLTAGVFTAQKGANYTLDATGHNLTVANSGVTAIPTNTGLGGNLNFTADSVDFNTTVLLPSGNLSLHAKTGDVTVDKQANVDLSGRAVYFGNKVDYTPGGGFTASADQGNVNLLTGAQLDMSSGGSSAATGSLVLSAVQGEVSIADGTLILAAGGSAKIDAANYSSDVTSGSSVDKLLQAFNQAGINNSINIRSRVGDVIAKADITARAVNLTADQGKIDYSGQIHAQGITGAYMTTANSDPSSTILTLANTSGLQVGDHLAANQLAANTVITKISGNQVTLSTHPLASISAGATLTDVSAIGATHTITNLNQTTSNVIGVASISGLKLGDTLSGAGLPAGTTIAYLPTLKTLQNGVSDYWLVLSAPPAALLTPNVNITDSTSGVTISNYVQNNTKLTPSNTLTLDDVSGLQVGQYLVGAGVAANTTITGINGNTISLSALPNSQVAVGESLTVVDSNRLAAVNGGNVILNAGKTITLADNSLIDVHSDLNQGGQVVLSSLLPAGANNPNGAIITASTAVINAGGVAGKDQHGTSFAEDGTVSMRVARTAQGVNLTPVGLAGEIMGNNPQGFQNFNVIGVAQYSNADIPNGQITADVINNLQQATYTFMSGANITNLDKTGLTPTLLAGIELNYNGNLSLSSPWDFSGWRDQNGNPGELVIRASGDLSIAAPLSDGFQTGSVGGVTINDQLMQNKSWSYTLLAGADLASADPQTTSHVAHTLTIGTNNNPVDVVNNPQVQVRTGTGNIALAASGDITIMTNGTVYDAGQSSTVNPYGTMTNVETGKYFYVEYPQNGGNLSIMAGGNINGAVTNTNYNNWMQRICCTNSLSATQALFIPTAWGLNLGYANSPAQVAQTTDLFQQNVGSFGGGNVAIQAGGNITNLEVAMPTTGKPLGTNTYNGTGSITGKSQAQLASFSTDAIDIQGGGSLQVNAGGNVAGGSYYLGQGVATMNAGGAITASDSWTNGPVLYSGNTQFNLNAVSGTQLGGVIDPMMAATSHSSSVNALRKTVDFFSYTDASSVAVRSLAGDINLAENNDQASIYPGSLQVSAFGGSVVLQNNITLFPSAVGQLNVFAKQDIKSADPVNTSTILMSDYAPNAIQQALPTAYAPSTNPNYDLTAHVTDASQQPLHVADLLAANFVTQIGDIKNIGITMPKLTVIKAGRDISHDNIVVQNIHNSDVTVLDAGRDLIYPTQLNPSTGAISPDNTGISVAGPGSVLVKTGRNLDLGASNGLVTVGDRNLLDASGAVQINPALIRPYFVSTAGESKDTNQLTLANTTGLVVGEQLINKALPSNTIITAISGNTVTLSNKPTQDIQANALFSTADSSSSYFTQAAANPTVNQLTLKDASGLQVGEQLVGTGLAANTIITAINGNVVTLSTNLLQNIAAGSLLEQTTVGATGTYVADLNNGAAVTAVSGLQGAVPDYVGFMNSEATLQTYIASLVTNVNQLISNGTNAAEISIYQQAIANYQALLPVFDANKQLASNVIVDFMRQMHGNDQMTTTQAIAAFSAMETDPTKANLTLPIQSQLNALLLPVLLQEINLNGTASAEDKALGNSLGYDAINALFPGSNWQGDMNMYFSTIQTQSGGDINLFAPGGGVNVGLAVALGVGSKTTDQLGIIAKGAGSVDAVVADNFLVNTSRVFTLNGGDILLWSSDGNIDAGKGAKSAVDVPPVVANFVNGNLNYTQAPSLSGSGIRTEGLFPGNVALFAPKGVVNAAEAGIAGKNVTISATAVLGAQNISFSGSGTGVPQASTSSVASGLVGASNTTSSVTQAAQSGAEEESGSKNQVNKNALLSLLTVDLLGFGD
jgi:filamentous hemagglutinin family protein